VLAVGLLGLAAGLAAHQIVGEKPPDLAAVAAPAPRPAVEPGRVVEFGPVAAVRLGDIDFPRYPHQLEMANVNGTLFFPADGADGPALWKCGATPDGPKAELVKACGPASDDFAPVPGFLTDVNGTLFFVPGGGHGNELWKSDGTEAGTVLVKRFEFSRHNKDLRFLSRPVAVGKTVFFTHGNGKGNCGLWKSDGTEAGTVLVKGGIEGIYLHANYPRTAAVVNGTLFFVAYADGESGLWKTDGTPEGTALLRRVDTAHHIRWPYYLTDFNGTLFFLAAGPDRGLGLWKSDGTAAGTGMVKEINPSHDNTGLHPDIGNLTVVGRTLFFVANDGVHGRKPWKSDGTAAGTMMVKDVSPAPFIPMTAWRLNVRLDAMAGVDGVLFFVSDDGTLWKSDGTEAGTVPVKRIASYLGQDPRGVSPNCASLTNVNGLLYCAVDDDGDFKLWRSDGTEAGTVLVTERKYDRNWIKLVGNRLAAVTPIGGATFFTTARLSETRPETLRMELWHVPAPR